MALSRFIRDELKDTECLLESIPPLTVTVFILCVVLANLLANKEMYSFGPFALDCGFFFSWVMFLCMDIVCKRWGAKAAIKLSIIALLSNLLICLVFYIATLTPGMWNAFYATADENRDVALKINEALNQTFAGSWYVVFGSALAFLMSSIVNAFINESIGRVIDRRGFYEFAIRSYVSTTISQFIDNFIFATVVSKVFFDWTWSQVFLCTCTGVLIEVVGEIALSGFGYKILQRWEKKKIGSAYLSDKSF